MLAASGVLVAWFVVVFWIKQLLVVNLVIGEPKRGQGCEMGLLNFG